MPARDFLKRELLRVASRLLRHTRPPDDPPCGEVEVVVRDGTGLGAVVRGPYDPESDPIPAPSASHVTGNEYARCCGHVEKVLRAAGRGLTLDEVMVALEAAGHEWSDRHVRRALKVLRSAGRVTWHRGVGYRLSS